MAFGSRELEKIINEYNAAIKVNFKENDFDISGFLKRLNNLAFNVSHLLIDELERIARELGDSKVVEKFFIDDYYKNRLLFNHKELILLSGVIYVCKTESDRFKSKLEQGIKVSKVEPWTLEKENAINKLFQKQIGPYIVNKKKYDLLVRKYVYN